MTEEPKGQSLKGPSWTEADRLAALHRTGILDTPPEQGFDDLVRLAADLLGVPMAAIHLVAEDRQWGKAEIGLGVRDIPRDIAFCPQAMLEPEGLVIPDAAEDSRFSANPLVTGAPGIRFYAGMPLEAEGLPIGALCIIDTNPHEGGLDERQRFVLRTLASQVSSQIALRRTLAERDRALAELARSAALQRQTLDSVTDYAIVSTDLVGRVTGWNTGAERVLGWTEAEMLGQTAERFFTPEDRAEGRIGHEMRRALETGRGNDERWHLHKDGHRFWANGAMMPLRNEDGDAVGFVKVLRDRTEQHRSAEALAEAHDSLRRAQEAGRVGLFSVRIEDGILHATPEFSRLYGLEPSDTRPAEEFERLVVPEDASLVSRAVTRRSGEALTDVRYRIRRADTGELRWIARRAEFEYDDQGRPVRFVGVARDVTEERAAEDTLQRSEAHWRGLFERLQEGLIIGELVRDPTGRVTDWRYLDVNPAWGALVGFPPEQAIGQTLRTMLPSVQDSWVSDMARVVETGEPAAFTREVVGLGRWYEGHAFALEDDRFAVVFAEVTGRMDAEARRIALRTLDDRLRDMRDLPAMSAAAAEILGRTLACAHAGYGTFMDDGETLAVEPDWAAPGIPSVAGRHALSSYGTYGDDLRRGRTVVIEDSGTDPRTARTADSLAAISARSLVNLPIVEGGRAVAMFFVADAVPRAWTEAELGFIRNVAERTRSAIERRRAETDLRNLAASLEQQVAARTAERDRVWRNSRDLLVVIGANGIFRAVNPAWTAILGHDPAEVAGRSFLDFIWPEDAGLTQGGLDDAASDRDLTNFENRYRHRDGTPRWISWHTSTEGDLVYAYGRDVTSEKEVQAALRQTEDVLRQSQKMEAVGQLTGGLAHDFNNLLTGIIGALELLSTRIAQGRYKDVDRYVSAAQGASRRAAALTHRLLAFSRQQTLDPRPTDVNRLVSDMEELVRRTVGPSIALAVMPQPELWPTLVDPNQLENALLNLCINARDAMPDGGRLNIETANIVLDARVAGQRDMQPGQYVAVCVTDTGMGMTDDVIRKAFDPFFTTKPLGQGTGLGLSMIYGFVRQSGGQVRIDSAPGRGTTMRLYLPRHLGPAEEPEPAPDLNGAPRAGRGETVLVVDDEPTIRMLVMEVLEELGYAAIEAADGASGLGVLRSDARVDLLVTDVGLPGGMNGRQMADLARIGRPGLKVLFITGFAENAALGNGQLEPGMHVMAKPFAMETLAGRIRELIADP
ncbi:PAS domain S-box protein [Roseomonas sp. WA12]